VLQWLFTASFAGPALGFGLGLGRLSYLKLLHMVAATVLSLARSITYWCHGFAEILNRSFELQVS